MAGTWSGGTWWRSPGWPAPAWVMGNATALSATRYKIGEMMIAHNRPAVLLPGGGLGAAPDSSTPVVTSQAAATPAVSTNAAQVPTSRFVWTDANGNEITSAVCGSVYSQTIPGYEGQQVYMIQTQDGKPQFQGTFSIPMSNFQSSCPPDAGTYQAWAYDIGDGHLIATGTFQVVPQGSAAAPGQGATAPVPGGTTATGSTLTTIEGMFSNLTASDWLLIAAGLLVLFRGGRGNG